MKKQLQFILTGVGIATSLMYLHYLLAYNFERHLAFYAIASIFLALIITYHE